MEYSLESDASFSAQVEMNKDVPIGTMVRSTSYNFQNYAPLSLDTVRSVLGEERFLKFWPDISSEVLVYRDGEQRVPIGGLIQLLSDLGDPLSEVEVKTLYELPPVWSYEIPNLVVMAGRTDSLDKHFKASAYTAAWYVGLVSGTPTFAEADTMASHAGWFEVGPFAGARPTLTLGTVVTGSVDNAASKAVYAITATMVVGGAFLVTLPTQGQTSGTLYGGAAFTGGNRSVVNGDTLNVTVSLTAASA